MPQLDSAPGTTDMPTVSVVLATCNGARFLRRQLDTLAAQTSLPDELVVGDDRSDDSTVAMLEAFAREVPFPVRIDAHREKIGFRRNFMGAAAAAAGALILFCDQDDAWLPAKVATVRQAFRDDPALTLLYHNATVVDAEEQPREPMFDGAHEQAMLASGGPPPWHYARGLVQAFRSDLRAHDDLWEQSREHFGDEPMGHDRWYFFLAFALGTVGFCDTPLLLYRQHGRNAFGADWDTSFRERLRKMLTHSTHADEPVEQGARARERVLRRIIPRLSGRQREQATRWADRYGDFAARFARRRSLYAAPALGARAVALGAAMRHGDYRGGSWGFHPGSIPRDVIGGVLLGGARA